MAGLPDHLNELPQTLWFDPIDGQNFHSPIIGNTYLYDENGDKIEYNFNWLRMWGVDRIAIQKSGHVDFINLKTAV